MREPALFRIRWASSGRTAQSAPNPAYPDGVVVDMTAGQTPHCEVTLPYPAPEVGVWIVECESCGLRAAATAAGRPDDPRAVQLPCWAVNLPAGST